MISSRFLKLTQNGLKNILRRNISSTSCLNGLPSTECELYTQEHHELKKTVRKIVDKDINPYVEEWEAAEIYPAHQVFKKLGEAGFLGITRSPEYGGLGLDYSYSLALFEELGRVKCGGIPMSIMVHTDCSTPALANFGSDELKKEFLVPAIAGDVVTSIGVSEPQAGSDVANIQTRAERRGDDLIINGSKMWITNGCQADWICLLANTSKGPLHKNKSLIIVPMKTKGVHVNKKIQKMGNHSSDTAQIFFEDVRVPAKNIIGEEGMGFMYQMVQFQDERLAGLGLACSGMAEVIEATIDYCRERKIFGAPVLDNQVVHYRLAELNTELECLKSLLYRAAGLMVKGENVTYLASMGKLKAGKLSREIGDTCLQYWGGMGYSSETLVSRYYRDARLISIGGGADEVMTAIICKMMGIMPKPSQK